MAAFQQVPHQGSWPGFMEVGATNDQDHSMIDPLEASFIRLYSVMGKFDLYGNYTTDPLLRSRRELVAQIFMLVDHPENLELSVAALRIIQDMSGAAQFEPLPGSPHKLFTILEELGQLSAILKAFMNRLEREEDERLRLIGIEDSGTVLQAENEAAYEFGLANIIRLQILDLILENCTKPGYNFVHFLLGFDLQKGVREAILDESNDNCLFLILDILDYGLGNPNSPVVALEHPSFSAKAYELVCALVSGRITSKPILRLFNDPKSRFFNFLERHFAKSSVELLQPTNLYFTNYELRGKCWIFKALAIEKNIAAHQQDCKSFEFLTKEFKKIVEYFKATQPCGQLAIQASTEDQFEIACAVTGYIQSLTKLVQVIQFQTIDKSLASRLSFNLTPVILHFLKNSNLPSEAKEALGSILLLLVTSEQNLDQDFVNSLIEIICHAESSFVLRGYAYSAFSAIPSEVLVKHSNTIAGHHDRLVTVIMKDLGNGGADLDSWKTLACTFYTQVIKVLPSVSIASLASGGYLKPLVQSLAIDEQNLQKFFSSSVQPLNSFYLWKSKFSLLKLIVASSTLAIEQLVDSGLMEQLTALSIIDRYGSGDLVGGLPIISQNYLIEVTECVMSLVSLLALQNSELNQSLLHRGILLFLSRHFDLVSRYLVVKTNDSKATTHPDLMRCAAIIINYAGIEAIPIAATHGVSMRHLWTNMLVKGLLGIERDTNGEALHTSLEMCSNALEFIAKTRLKGDHQSLVDFDDLPADQLTRQGKLPISIIERLMIAFNKLLTAGPSDHDLVLKVFEQAVFIILLDLEDRMESDSGKPANGSNIPIDKVRSISKQFDAFSTFAHSKDETNDPVLQTTKRWIRQLQYYIRK